MFFDNWKRNFLSARPFHVLVGCPYCGEDFCLYPEFYLYSAPLADQYDHTRRFLAVLKPKDGRESARNEREEDNHKDIPWLLRNVFVLVLPFVNLRLSQH